MNNIYIITFKKDNLKRAYTTLTAITEAHSSEETGLSKTYLERVPFIDNVYKGKRITIERFTVLTKGDVIRQRENKTKI